MNKITEVILARVPILDYIKQVLEVKQKGNNWIARCPFHDDQRPSLSISPSKRLFKCWSCQVGGNVINFVMKWEKCEWKPAVLKLNEQFGLNLEIKRFVKPIDPAIAAQRAVLESAAKWFHLQLLNAKENDEALKAFCKKRAITAEMIKTWKLGWADQKWDLFEFLHQKGHMKAAILNSGLFKVRENNTVFPFFHKRLIFPLYDENGEIVGFTGRTILATEEIKYLHFPTTQLFQKRTFLYNFARAKNAQTAHCYLVEGLFDVLRIASYSHAVVALMGTSLSAEQAKLLTTHFQTVIIWLDNDRAGWEATLASALVLIKTRLTVKIIYTAETFDPDAWLLQFKPPQLPEGENLLTWFFRHKFAWTVDEKKKYEQVIKEFWAHSDLNSQTHHKPKLHALYGKSWVEALDNYQVVKTDKRAATETGLQTLRKTSFDIEEGLVWIMMFFDKKIYQIFQEQKLEMMNYDLESANFLIENWYNKPQDRKGLRDLLVFLEKEMMPSLSRQVILMLLSKHEVWLKETFDGKTINAVFNRFATFQAKHKQTHHLLTLSAQELAVFFKTRQNKKPQIYEYISSDWTNPFGIIKEKPQR